MNSVQRTADQPQDFESVKKRLEEIADAVSSESMPLDEALDLFEEAVSLGLKVSDYIEEGIVVEEGAVKEGEALDPCGDVSDAVAASASEDAASSSSE